MLSLTYNRSLAATLLKERRGAPLGASAVASKAHWRWDRQQHVEAATLFCVAAERAAAEHSAQPDAPDDTLNYLARAAINFNLAGQDGVAEPMLWEVTAGDWAAAGRAGDSHMTEWAFAHLLYNRASGEPGPFEALFEEAERRCRELGWAFPRIHSHQEALLTIALEIGSACLVRRIVPLIQARRPISHAARSLLQRAESFLDQNP